MLNTQDKRELYCKYFYELKRIYLVNFIVYVVLLVGELLFIGITRDKSLGGWITVLLAITVPLTVIQVIAYVFRLHDIGNLSARGFETKVNDITVEKVKNKEVNDTYCTIYLDYIGEELVVGKSYKVCYLNKSFGKYIVDFVEI